MFLLYGLTLNSFSINLCFADVVSAMFCSICLNTSTHVNADITCFCFIGSKCFSFTCFCICCIRICQFVCTQQIICIFCIRYRAVKYGVICIKAGILGCYDHGILISTSIFKIAPHIDLVKFEYIAKVNLEVYTCSI